MRTDLTNLTITADEIEALAGLDYSDSLAIATYQALAFRHPKQVASLIVTELFILIFALIFMLSSSLIVLRHSNSFVEDSPVVTQSLIGIVVLAIIAVFIWNIYLYRQAQQMRSLAYLMREIERFNDVIHTIDWIDQLENHSTRQLQAGGEREEAIAALHLTRDSLVSSLQAEKLIRLKRGRVSYHDILTNLETNLTALMAFGTNSQTSEYGRLLNQALHISMSVHREISKL